MQISRKFLLAVVFLAGARALACLHFDQAFQGKVEEGIQQAFLFHDGKKAHLVLKTDLHATEGQLPKQVSWVMPFPAMPEHYEEVSAEVFSELNGFANLTRSAGWGKKDYGTPRLGGIQVFTPKEVGKYTIQEIKILSDGSAKEFNEWLEAHHYNPMPIENQKTYLKKGEVFLAITANIEGNSAQLKPLHVTYPATELSYPLKFSHDTRTFGVNLFVFSEKPLGSKAGFPPYLKYAADVTYNTAFVTVQKLTQLKSLLGNRSGHLYRFEGRDLNTDGKLLKNLAQDPTFAVRAAKAR